MNKKIFTNCLILAVLPLLYFCSGHPYQQGQRLWEQNCQRCHGEKLEGFEDLYPSIAHSAYIVGHQIDLACIIRHGSNYLNEQPGRTKNVIPMPENHGLNNIEILNIVNYIYYQMDIDHTERIDRIDSILLQCDHP